MSKIGKKERETQNRIVAFFQKEPGYRCPGKWEDRETNSNVEEEMLRVRLPEC
jgi:type I restriction enzyme R subunit